MFENNVNKTRKHVQKFETAKIKLANGRLIEIFFLEKFPHPDKYFCEIGCSFSDPSLKISIYSIGVSHLVGGREHMNTYQGGRISQVEIIPIKCHFASLFFGIISPQVGSAPP